MIIPITNLPKPKRGEACNGCGLCCATEPCRLANEFLDCHTGKCVALEIENGRTYCGLVRRPAHYIFGEDVPEKDTAFFSATVAGALGLGMGCDSDDI